MPIDPKKIAEWDGYFAALAARDVDEDEYREHLADMALDAIPDLIAERSELLALLREVEWKGPEYRPGEQVDPVRRECPVCGGVRGPLPERSPLADIEGHVVGCGLAAFLRSAT